MKKVSLNLTLNYCTICCQIIYTSANRIKILITFKRTVEKLKIQNIEYLLKISEKKVSAILKVIFAWKHLVLGFIYYGNQSSVILNNVVSFIAFKVFQYKIKGKMVEESEGLILFLRSLFGRLFLVNQQAQTVKLDYCILRNLF